MDNLLSISCQVQSCFCFFISFIHSFRLRTSTTIIGRGQTVDLFLDSSIRKGLISRAHAQIIKSEGENGTPVYSIPVWMVSSHVVSDSEPAFYVNDWRVKGSIVLNFPLYVCDFRYICERPARQGIHCSQRRWFDSFRSSLWLKDSSWCTWSPERDRWWLN